MFNNIASSSTSSSYLVNSSPTPPTEKSPLLSRDLRRVSNSSYDAAAFTQANTPYVEVSTESGTKVTSLTHSPSNLSTEGKSRLAENLQGMRQNSTPNTSASSHVTIQIEPDDQADSLSSTSAVHGTADTTRLENRTHDNPEYNAITQSIKNLGLTLARNLVSVGGPTAAREFIRFGVLPGLAQSAPLAVVATGGVAAAFPVALQLIGLARDILSSPDKKISSEVLGSRIANILLVTGTSMAMGLSGSLTKAASSLIAAVFVYVPLRDMTQYFLRLSDNNKPDITFAPTLSTAGAYVVNQTIVDRLMSVFSTALSPYMGAVAANMLARTIVNIAGETADEMTYRGFNARFQENPQLTLSLGLRAKEEITVESILNQLLTTLAGRASLFSAAFSNAYTFSAVHDAINSLLVGVTLGAGYLPFIYSHADKTPTLETAEQGAVEPTVIPEPQQSTPAQIHIETEA